MNSYFSIKNKKITSKELKETPLTEQFFEEKIIYIFICN